MSGNSSVSETIASVLKQCYSLGKLNVNENVDGLRKLSMRGMVAW